MRRIVVGAALLVPLAVAACSSSATSNSITTPSASVSATSTPSSTAPPTEPAPTAVPSGGSESVPKLEVGQSVDVQIDPNISGDSNVPVQVTLLAERSATTVNSAGSPEQAPAGTKFVCLDLRLKNIGTTTPDKHSIGGVWVGVNGQVAEPQDPFIDCSDMGVGKSGQTMFSQPNPAPGQFVEGSIAAQVPAGPGELLWSRNSDDVHLFRTPG